MTATPTPAPVTVRRADYAPPAFWIDRVHLTLDLDAAKTRDEIAAEIQDKVLTRLMNMETAE